MPFWFGGIPMIVDTTIPPRTKLMAHFKRQFMTTVLLSIALGALGMNLFLQWSAPADTSPGVILGRADLEVMTDILNQSEAPITVVVAQLPDDHTSHGVRYNARECFRVQFHDPSGVRQIIGEGCNSAIRPRVGDGTIGMTEYVPVVK